jgi:UDP-2,4-diacetamido-2,4,6-trideoxy-beta-L-altropyranose hydrolase
MQVVIRTEAHPDIGLGHMMRMLALADWLRLHDVQAIFVLTRFSDPRFSDAFVQDIQKRIDQRGVELHWLQKLDAITDAKSMVEQFFAADWFVLDSYQLGQDWLNTMADFGRRVCVLDDHPKLHRTADLVVDPTLFSQRAHTANKAVCFAGAHYFLAAPELARRHFLLNPEKFCSASTARRWFVSFGGTDVKGMLPHTLRTLAEFLGPDARVDIGVNPSVAHMEDIQSARLCFKADTHLIHESIQIIEALTACDFAIGAAGGMTLERALLGIPSLTTQVADNQADIYRRLGEEHLSYTLEPEAFTGDDALRKKLAEILTQTALWPEISAKCLSLTQGLGAAWITQFLSRDKYGSIYLRRPAPEFRERLFVWQCMPEVRQYSRNKKSPVWQEHCAWYEQHQASHKSVMAEIMYQDFSVGMLRLDHKKSDPLQFEVSILIAPDYHGRGIAPMALRLARRLVPFGEFLAYIKAENRASFRAFAAAGYKSTSQPDYFRREAIYASPN